MSEELSIVNQTEIGETSPTQEMGVELEDPEKAAERAKLLDTLAKISNKHELALAFRDAVKSTNADYRHSQVNALLRVASGTIEGRSDLKLIPNIKDDSELEQIAILAEKWFAETDYRYTDSDVIGTPVLANNDQILEAQSQADITVFSLIMGGRFTTIESATSYAQSLYMYHINKIMRRQNGDDTNDVYDDELDGLNIANLDTNLQIDSSSDYGDTFSSDTTQGVSHDGTGSHSGDKGSWAINNTSGKENTWASTQQTSEKNTTWASYIKENKGSWQTRSTPATDNRNANVGGGKT